jgi:hypothetical protein
MSTLFWLRIPFLILFFALSVWLVLTVYRKGGKSGWL